MTIIYHERHLENHTNNDIYVIYISIDAKLVAFAFLAFFVFVFPLLGTAVPCRYFRDGRLDADSPASGWVDLRTSIVIFVCHGLGGGRLGVRDRVVDRLVCCVGGRKMCSVFVRDVGSCNVESRCSDLIL